MNSKDTGAALIMVLFIAAILGSISTLLIVKTKQHTQRIAIAKDYMQAERLLVSDLSHLLYKTQGSPYAIIGDSVTLTFPRTGLPDGINLQGSTFSFRSSKFNIQDMGGLLPVNAFDQGQLKQYLNELGWPKAEVHRFLDSLKDWIDQDSLQHINGAESGKYSVYGYPLNQFIQSTKELGLLANVDKALLRQLSQDKNLIVYAAGRQTKDYAPDDLLPVFNSSYDAKNIKLARQEARRRGLNQSLENYSSGNWIIRVSTGYGQAKSSKMLHLLRRFGESRPFVISDWQERAN